MDVDTSNQRDVWLVKVPKYMATAWKNAAPKAELGKIQECKQLGVKKLKFITDPKLKQQTLVQNDNKLPDEHMLTLTPLLNQRMVIMSQHKPPQPLKPGTTSSVESTTNPADKISFEGNVKHKGELRPVGDMSYMNLKSQSIKLAAKPARVTQILDKVVTSYKPRGATQLAHEADLRRKKEEGKKTIREDKEIVQGRLFSAFEKQQYYNIKDLVRITGQSIPYLKEILKEICNYCSKSTHKNMWELKPEYRHYKNK